MAKREAIRSSLERTAERLERRFKEVEDLARANRRELDVQFKRISTMQEQLDRLTSHHKR